MNQVYKVIWSRVKNCYVVVSELTKRVGRGSEDTGIKSYSFRAFLCALIIAGCMLPADADAAQGLTHAVRRLPVIPALLTGITRKR